VRFGRAGGKVGVGSFIALLIAVSLSHALLIYRSFRPNSPAPLNAVRQDALLQPHSALERDHCGLGALRAALHRHEHQG